MKFITFVEKYFTIDQEIWRNTPNIQKSSTRVLSRALLGFQSVVWLATVIPVQSFHSIRRALRLLHVFFSRPPSGLLWLLLNLWLSTHSVIKYYFEVWKRLWFSTFGRNSDITAAFISSAYSSLNLYISSIFKYIVLLYRSSWIM